MNKKQVWILNEMITNGDYKAATKQDAEKIAETCNDVWYADFAETTKYAVPFDA